MKCGYMSYEEFIEPYRCLYSCKYFSFVAGTEKMLCAGCTIDNKGIPHIPELEDGDNIGE